MACVLAAASSAAACAPPAEPYPEPPVAPPPGNVPLELAAPSFRAGQVIHATVTNDLDRPLYTSDMKSDCSIAILERWDGEGWQPLLGCMMERAPMVITLEPGREHEVTINPLSSNFGVAPGTAPPAFGAGLYRLGFSYRLVPGREGDEPYQAHSRSFQVTD